MTRILPTFTDLVLYLILSIIAYISTDFIFIIRKLNTESLLKWIVVSFNGS